MKNSKIIHSIKPPFYGVFVVVVMSIGNFLIAQNGRIDRSEMGKLNSWVGEWKDEGWQTDPKTRQRISLQEEGKVESKLDSLTVLVEGEEMSGDEQVHHAPASVYYNLEKGHDESHSIVKQGIATLAKGQFTKNGEFVWGFEIPQGEIRYTLQIERDTRTKVGAFSMNGSTWYPTMEMKLKRVSK